MQQLLVRTSRVPCQTWNTSFEDGGAGSDGDWVVVIGSPVLCRDNRTILADLDIRFPKLLASRKRDTSDNVETDTESGDLVTRVSGTPRSNDSHGDRGMNNYSRINNQDVTRQIASTATARRYNFSFRVTIALHRVTGD